MTSAEYIQLKAYARVDGAWLALIWTASFACYVAGLANSMLGLLSILLAVASPFFVARRLKAFRDKVRQGSISFMRSWAFVILVFFYAGLLFALVQFAYLAYLDHGYMLSEIEKATNTPEFAAFAAQYGMGDTVGEMLNEIRLIRPIDFSLNALTTNITLGIVFGLPIAALMKKGDDRVTFSK